MVSSKSTVSLAFLVQLILEQYGFELLESTYTWRKEWFLGVKDLGRGERDIERWLLLTKRCLWCSNYTVSWP